MTSNTSDNTANYAADSRFPGPDPYAPLGDVPAFTVTSSDIEEGAEIAERFRAPENISPQLSWTDVPEGTKSFACLLYTSDAADE